MNDHNGVETCLAATRPIPAAQAAISVSLTKHGRQSVVMMSAEAYNSLVSGDAGAGSQGPSATATKKEALSFLARQAAKAAEREED